MTATTTPATPGSSPPATVPASQVIPFPMPWGGGSQPPWLPAGCCAPGGMDALMKCYMDIQAASCFIAQVMIDQINNNPAVTAAMIAAIEKSGSSLPTIGVTNGAAAQPGQVGEYQLLLYNGAFTTGTQDQVFSVGVIPPGDWMLSTYCLPSVPVTSMLYGTNPEPAGLSTALAGYVDSTAGMVGQLIVGQSAQLLTSVPTLMAFSMATVAAAAGTFQFGLEAWRMR